MLPHSSSSDGVCVPVNTIFCQANWRRIHERGVSVTVHFIRPGKNRTQAKKHKIKCHHILLFLIMEFVFQWMGGNSNTRLQRQPSVVSYKSSGICYSDACGFHSNSMSARISFKGLTYLTTDLDGFQQTFCWRTHNVMSWRNTLGTFGGIPSLPLP